MRRQDNLPFLPEAADIGKYLLEDVQVSNDHFGSFLNSTQLPRSIVGDLNNLEDSVARSLNKVNNTIREVTQLYHKPAKLMDKPIRSSLLYLLASVSNNFISVINLESREDDKRKQECDRLNRATERQDGVHYFYTIGYPYLQLACSLYDTKPTVAPCDCKRLGRPKLNIRRCTVSFVGRKSTNSPL